MQGSKLYVGNLGYAVTSSELETLFSTYGVVKQVTVIEGKGFGFVEMGSVAEAEKAKEGLDSTDFRSDLRVTRCLKQREGGESAGYRDTRCLVRPVLTEAMTTTGGEYIPPISLSPTATVGPRARHNKGGTRCGRSEADGVA
jgi:RNA recognition motif-containing protein